MIAPITQPSLLPWLGYLHDMSQEHGTRRISASCARPDHPEPGGEPGHPFIMDRKIWQAAIAAGTAPRTFGRRRGTAASIPAGAMLCVVERRGSERRNQPPVPNDPAPSSGK